MADLRDPQAYNIWDKERWSKKARLATAAGIDDAAEKRQFETAKGLQELVNSGQLDRAVMQFVLGERAADSDVKRTDAAETSKYDKFVNRLRGVFGMTPEQRQTPEGRAAISLNEAGINAGNRGSRGLGAAPQMERFGEAEAGAGIADALANTAESRVREISSNSMRPLAGQAAVTKTLKDIAGAGLFADEAVMKQENLAAERQRLVKERELEDAERAARIELMKSQTERNARQGVQTPAFDLVEPPKVIRRKDWQNPTPAPAPAR